MYQLAKKVVYIKDKKTVYILEKILLVIKRVSQDVYILERIIASSLMK